MKDIAINDIPQISISGVQPYTIDVAEWILTDQRAGAVLQRVFGAAFADTGDADVGLDRHHHVALIEEEVQVRRPIDPHSRNPGLWQFGRRGSGVHQAECRRRRDGAEECSSIHRSFLPRAREYAIQVLILRLVGHTFSELVRGGL